MKRYYEKADEEILNKCKSFIQENKGLSDYTVYKSAINLTTELINSLLESHKDFNEDIKKEIDTINNEEDEIKRLFMMNAFKEKEYTLFLDVEAHNIIKELDSIKDQAKEYKYIVVKKV